MNKVNNMMYLNLFFATLFTVITKERPNIRKKSILILEHKINIEQV